MLNFDSWNLQISMINPLECFFGIEGHVALDRNPGLGYNILLLLSIPGDILSACPLRQFHTLPGLLDSQTSLSNFFPNSYMQCKGVHCTNFMMVFGMTRSGDQTRDLPHEVDTLTIKSTRCGLSRS